METKPLPAHCTRYSFYVLQDQMGRALHYAYRAGRQDSWKLLRKLKDELERNPSEVIVKFCMQDQKAGRIPPRCQACAAMLKPPRRSESNVPVSEP